ncbi:methyl-accepting chemotaxis protein [Pseudomonas silesiensis]|uniref:methyl-accepting chemotaxis protein n=1 Tax=Pseudomonas silesiensis TaxID=1853130 RepID=UPI003BB7D71F
MPYTRAQHSRGRAKGRADRPGADGFWTGGDLARVPEHRTTTAGNVEARSAQGSTANLQTMGHQRQDIDQVATAMYQMNLSAQEIARNTASASEATGAILQAIDDGTGLIERTTQIVARQGEDLANANRQVNQLSVKSEKIGSALDIIRDIAEQTNLLALNAEIEAARAGTVAGHASHLPGLSRTASLKGDWRGLVAQGFEHPVSAASNAPGCLVVPGWWHSQWQR